MSNKINFIHIPKNGGVTIKHTHLENLISPSSPDKFVNPTYTKDLLDVMKKYGEHHGYGHARWRDLNNQAQKNKSFAMVRNPWSRTVSRYTFLLAVFTNPNNPVHSNPNYNIVSFEEFLEERHKWGNIPYFWHRAIHGWYLQKDYVTDVDGKLCVDVMRFENFDEDLNKYFNTDFEFDRRNISNNDNRDYRDFYTVTTKKIIEDWYAEDIKYFGFTFDGPATKNIWNKE